MSELDAIHRDVKAMWADVRDGRKEVIQLVKRVDRHEHAIYGNGDEGLKDRTLKNELGIKSVREHIADVRGDIADVRRSRKQVWSAVVSFFSLVGTAVTAFFHSGAK